jgi:competence ComEA-like helix-hairpin-helix protein
VKHSWLQIAALLACLSSVTARADETKKLDLNQATREQLIGLGLSESQAAQVVSHREKTGAFLQIDELLVVPQMRPDTVEAIRNRVTVDE